MNRKTAAARELTVLECEKDLQPMLPAVIETEPTASPKDKYDPSVLRIRFKYQFKHDQKAANAALRFWRKKHRKSIDDQSAGAAKFETSACLVTQEQPTRKLETPDIETTCMSNTGVHRRIIENYLRGPEPRAA